MRETVNFVNFTAKKRPRGAATVPVTRREGEARVPASPRLCVTFV